MFFGQHWLVVSVMLSWNDNVNPVVCTMVGSSAPRENTSPPQVFTGKRENIFKMYQLDCESMLRQTADAMRSKRSRFYTVEARMI